MFLGRYDGHHVPLVYALTVDKKATTYDLILRILKKFEPTINPTDVITDFEQAAMLSIKDNFPDADIHGCFFHFTQSVRRHIQQVGLLQIYIEDEDIALQLRLLIALAFVPSRMVVQAYDELVETEFFSGENDHKSKIDELLMYFQTTYIFGFNRHGKRTCALFDVNVMNVYDEKYLVLFYFLSFGIRFD